MKTQLIYTAILGLLFGGLLLMPTGEASAQRAFKKGEKLYEKGYYHEAKPHLEKTITKDSIAMAAIYLAEAQRRLRNFSDAEYWYRMLDDRGLLRAQDMYNYGLVLKNVGKYGEAKSMFEKFTQARPDDPRGPKMAFSAELAMDLLDQAPIYRTENMTVLNSEGDDYSPTFYNGQVVFVSSREGAEGKKSPVTGDPFSDVYTANRSDEKDFDGVSPFSKKLNSDLDDGPAAFNSDGTRIYFTRVIDAEGNPDLPAANKSGMFVKLFTAEFSNGEMSRIRQLPFTFDGYNYMHPAVSPDDKQLYFATDRPGGYGGLDLYRVDITGPEDFGNPVNLGSVINTQGEEVFPNIHSDGRLYFSSDFHPGMGGLDVFMAMPDGDGFSNVMNLRKGANSSADDFGMILDEDRNSGFMSSNRAGSQGGDDIYYIFRVGPDELVEEEEEPVIAESDKEKTPEPEFFIVSGRVFEKIYDAANGDWNATKKELLKNAKVVLMNNQMGRVGEDESLNNGEFAIRVEAPGEFTVVAKKNGYFGAAVEVDPNTLIGNEMEVEVTLERIVMDTPNPSGKMENVNFAYNSEKLTPTAQTNLERIARVLVENPEIHIELAGHACPIGTRAYNERLAAERARSVASFLINRHNIAQVRLMTKSYGEQDLLIDNPNSINDFAFNRRTEFIVRSLDGGQTISENRIKRPFGAQNVGKPVLTPEGIDATRKYMARNNIQAQPDDYDASPNYVKEDELQEVDPAPGVNETPAGTTSDRPKTRDLPAVEFEEETIEVADPQDAFRDTGSPRRELQGNSDTRIHVVQYGETLAKIARKYNTTVEQLMRLNNLNNSNINMHQRLRVR